MSPRSTRTGHEDTIRVQMTCKRKGSDNEFYIHCENIIPLRTDWKHSQIHTKKGGDTSVWIQCDTSGCSEVTYDAVKEEMQNLVREKRSQSKDHFIQTGHPASEWLDCLDEAFVGGMRRFLDNGGGYASLVNEDGDAKVAVVTEIS